MNAATPLIVFQDAVVSFERNRVTKAALTPINLTVRAGEIVSIVGPSGCGKSTLLNLVAGFVRPSSGLVRFRGESIRDVNTDVGYMTQSDMLLPWRTTEDNIILPLLIRKESRLEAQRRADDILAAVGLSDFRRHYPKELSGGMRKRASLAQILAYSPSTILMDEPFGALDAHLRLLMQQEVTRVVEQRGLSVLLVTHDIDEAITMSDRVIVFGGRPGGIVREIAVGFERPRDILAVRHEPEFQALFDAVWRELVPGPSAAEQEIENV